ncbi:hypothetical protein Pogu_2127 [Pyrobaculum oguniense TE7]|uniref:Uncharacterized protein n=1 Tax=Pyrobaculum oguniense (strain DSM 13380 / JCM 10595 / TE7) TaxID=698757 RepID=H6QCV8_PYROT|nr:hypothetical protein Pogu_2127 [Pyrobaculum oguniense TE7]
MECEYIEVKDLRSSVYDPVNLYIFDSVSDILAVLRSEGFTEPTFHNPATLRGRKPDFVLAKPVVSIGPIDRIIGEVARYHLRLWLIEAEQGVFGNAHVDIPTPVGHAANHDWGRAIIVEVFLRHGYWAKYERCDNPRGFDGYVAKIFKKPHNIEL